MIDVRNRFNIVNSIIDGVKNSKRTIVLSSNADISVCKMKSFVASIPPSINYKVIWHGRRVEMCGSEVIFKSSPEETRGIDREASIYFDD